MSNEKISYEELLNILTQLHVTHDKETVGNWFMKVLKAQKHLNAIGEIKPNRDCLLHDEIIGNAHTSKPTGTEFVGICTFFTKKCATSPASSGLITTKVGGTPSASPASAVVVPFKKH